MQIKIMDNVVEVGEKPLNGEELMVQLHMMLEAVQMAIDFIIVDGVDVTGDYQTYITERWEQIRVIEVKAKTWQEFMNEYLLSTADYLERAIPEVKPLADQFYQGASNKTWQKFEQLLEGLQWLTEVYSALRGHKTIANWNEYGNIVILLLGKLGELGEAMQNGDQVLIADLILYEILPVLEAMQLQVMKTLETVEEHRFKA